jgi:hypothetical protein
MPSLQSRMMFLILSPWLLAVPGCAKPASALQTYPPAALMVAEPKPVPTIDTVTSAQAAAAYNIAVESWGTRGWDAVRSLCVWAKERGLPSAPC